MSTLNVNNIDKESGSTLTIGGSGTTVNVSNMVPDVALSNRNLIINGAMNVAQRGTQVTGVTTGGYKTCDRWRTQINNLGTWTFDQSTDAPNGFSNSFKTTCTTADASPAAVDYCFLAQFIEAKNLQHLGFGTADAKSMTLSFWVKSNKTGSASLGILQEDNSYKMVSKSYTINSADTWEYKTISIPADTAGVINNDNGTGLQIDWWLNSGTDWSSGSLQSTWSTYDATHRNVSNLGVGGAVSDYFAITGVQLEVGDVATPFEHESYAETLQKSLRYFYRINGGTIQDCVTASSHGGNTFMVTEFPVEMRAIPTLSDANISQCYVLYGGGSNEYVTTHTGFQFHSTKTYMSYSATTLTSGYSVFGRLFASGSYRQFDAEL